MLINLSIWQWMLLSIGFVHTSHKPSSVSNHHHLYEAIAPLPSPVIISADGAIFDPKHLSPSSSLSALASKPSTFHQSLTSLNKPTRPKHYTPTNNSILISSYRGNYTYPLRRQHNVFKYPETSSSSGKILNLSESRHYFVQNVSCENILLTGSRGSIFNPGFPNAFSNGTQCSWTLEAKAHEIITISFDDLDIPESDHDSCNLSSGTDEPCCSTSAVIVRLISNKTIPSKRFCGRSEDNRDIFKVFILEGEGVQILFKGYHQGNGHPTAGGRGFHATYSRTWIGKPCLQETEVKCANGKCIDKTWMCNRRNECGDNSDEANCDHVCRESNEAQCLNEGSHTFSCYSFPKDRCDGNWNCLNGTDERDCDKCPNGMFVCSNGTICYSERARCNGNWDCSDFKDELNCGLCGPEKVSCGSMNGKDCFNPFTQKCNGVFDCPNGYDEMGCEKLQCSHKILCANKANCFSLEERCNGEPDCLDGSDERNCTADLCRSEHGTFLCPSGQCIHSHQVCDNNVDCENGADEINCTNEMCRPEQGNFLCNNGNCIQAILTCDRSNDCGDSSDEINCLKNSVITAALMGSLICGLLLVIAISCTCKLIALRQIEQHRASQDDSSCGTSINNLYSSSHIYQRYFPFSRGSTHSTSPLFSPDSEYFYREPPPSYASAVSGMDEYAAGVTSSTGIAAVGGATGSQCPSSITSSSSSRRRPRRIRTRSRRRPPTPPLQPSPSISEATLILDDTSNQRLSSCSTTSPSAIYPAIEPHIVHGSTTINPCPSSVTREHFNESLSHFGEPSCTSSSSSPSNHPLFTNPHPHHEKKPFKGNNNLPPCYHKNGNADANDDEDGSSQSTEIEQTAGGEGTEADTNSTASEPIIREPCPLNRSSSTSSTVTIELNNILPSSQSSSQLDCDQQPLLSGTHEH